MTDQITLDTPFVKDGVEHVSFWNGRVLTGEDLRDEQDANRESREILGKAIGAGVARGLLVSRGTQSTIVRVTAGVAVTAAGQAVELTADVDVALVVPPDPDAGDGVFVVCTDTPSATPPTTGTGSGIYVLTIAPASQSRDETSGVPYNGNGVASVCGPKYSVDGVSFRLAGVDAVGLADQAGHDAADVATLETLGGAAPDLQLRNVLAHLFLGTAARARLVAAPYAGDAAADYGAVDALRADGTLDDCEVPLAIVSWAGGKVEYADSWAVRRPPLVATAGATPPEAVGGPRPGVEGEATYHQFAGHLDDVIADLTAAQLAVARAVDRFRYLPAAGLVPLGPAGGFSEAQFFAGVNVRPPVTIPPALVVPLLGDARRYPPIDLSSGEVIYLYYLRGAAGTADDGTLEPQPHLMFTSSEMPFVGSQLEIDAVFPPGPLTLGQPIEIRGRNFAFTTGDARITFDGLSANAKAGSSDSRLLCDVPETLTVPQEGRPVTLEVSDGEQSDSVPVVVRLPEQPVLGDIDVAWQSTDPVTLLPGQPATFHYTVGSRLNQTADVTITATVTPTVMQPGIEVRDGAGNPLSGPVALDPTQTINVQVHATSVADVPSLELVVIAQAGDIAGEDRRTFEPGEENPPPDENITLTFDDFEPQEGSTGSHFGTNIRLMAGGVGDIEITAQLLRAGTYSVRVEPSTVDPPWGALLAEPDDGEWTATEAEIELDGVAGRTAFVTIANQAGGPPFPLDFIVQRQGAPSDVRIRFTLDTE